MNSRTTDLNVLPKKLQKGDLIGIVSPSAAISKNLASQLETGRDYLHKLGFKTVLSRNCMKDLDGSAGTPRERAEDINNMFSDSSINAIICSQGGDTANSVLPYLDYDVIRDNPKIFMGISDITVLLNVLHSKTGLLTFHGNDIMFGFGRKPTAYDLQGFTTQLMEGKTGPVKKNSKWTVVRPGIAEGRLIGGNLNCILKLAGTKYQLDFQDSILFLEAFDITPGESEYMLHQLKQIGAFQGVKGVIIGYIWGLQKSSKVRKGPQMETLIKKITSEYDFPIVKTNDFGHNCSNTTIPVGARARLTGTTNYSSLELLEPSVE